MKTIMAEFASKGVAGSGLGLGIAGTALGLLNNGGNGGGVLGGLFGNNNQATISALQAENGMLKAENYSDKSGTVEYLGFKFDKSDGEALINIMEKYKDD